MLVIGDVDCEFLRVFSCSHYELTFYLINLNRNVGAPLELKKLKVFLNDVLPLI